MPELVDPALHSDPVVTGGSQRPWLFIVDSNFDRMESLERTACQRYRVAATHRGRTALAALSRCRPAVVVAGEELSDMSGEEFLQAFAARLGQVRVPVVRSSELSGDGSQDLALILGSEHTQIESAPARREGGPGANGSQLGNGRNPSPAPGPAASLRSRQAEAEAEAVELAAGQPGLLERGGLPAGDDEAVPAALGELSPAPPVPGGGEVPPVVLGDEVPPMTPVVLGDEVHLMTKLEAGHAGPLLAPVVPEDEVEAARTTLFAPRATPEAQVRVSASAVVARPAAALRWRRPHWAGLVALRWRRPHWAGLVALLLALGWLVGRS